MDQVFDRPTRFTKNAFMVWRAKPATLVAPVYSELLGFQEGAAEVYAARLPEHLARTLERMIRRAAERA